jgi:hypothetical protein
MATNTAFLSVKLVPAAYRALKAHGGSVTDTQAEPADQEEQHEEAGHVGKPYGYGEADPAGNQICVEIQQHEAGQPEQYGGI